jgi:hypothetical protein
LAHSTVPRVGRRLIGPAPRNFQKPQNANYTEMTDTLAHDTRETL